MSLPAAVERRVRSTTTWAIRYGIPGFAIRTAARRGDLIARTASDPVLRDDPFAAYDEIRSHGPVMTARLVSATASWTAANRMLRDEAFHVAPGSAPTPFLQTVLSRAIDPWALGPADPPSLLALNGIEHSRIRRLVSKAFTARTVAAMAPRIRALADSLLDDIVASGANSFELVSRYASLLPVTMIAEILGVPVTQRSDFLRIADEAAKTLDPGLTWSEFRAADAAIRESHTILDERIRTLRHTPDGSLLSKLVSVTDGPDRLTDEELRTTALLLVGAGFETTQNLIGNAVVLLLSHPDQLAALQADPSGWENAVDEVLRYDSPVQVTLRIAGVSTTVDGVAVPEGTPVVIMLGGANRDPAVFADPAVFDVARVNARDHLSFSAGAHYCVGAQLARLEAAIALEALFERFPSLTLADEPVRRGTRTLRGYESIRLTPTPSPVAVG
jgi:cytochrome P450